MDWHFNPDLIEIPMKLFAWLSAVLLGLVAVFIAVREGEDAVAEGREGFSGKDPIWLIYVCGFVCFLIVLAAILIAKHRFFGAASVLVSGTLVSLIVHDVSSPRTVKKSVTGWPTIRALIILSTIGATALVVQTVIDLFETVFSSHSSKSE